MFNPGRSIFRCAAECRRHLFTSRRTLPNPGLQNDKHGGQSDPVSSTTSTARPRAREDWRFLPAWRRQKLSIQHKLATSEPARFAPHHKTNPPNNAQWEPRRKVSPDAMAGIRTLHAQHPDLDVPKLSELFKVSPDAIRRILKSRWTPTPEEAKRREERWRKRKDSIVAASSKPNLQTRD